MIHTIADFFVTFFRDKQYKVELMFSVFSRTSKAGTRTCVFVALAIIRYTNGLNYRQQKQQHQLNGRMDGWRCNCIRMQKGRTTKNDTFISHRYGGLFHQHTHTQRETREKLTYEVIKCGMKFIDFVGRYEALQWHKSPPMQCNVIQNSQQQNRVVPLIDWVRNLDGTLLSLSLCAMPCPEYSSIFSWSMSLNCFFWNSCLQRCLPMSFHHFYFYMQIDYYFFDFFFVLRFKQQSVFLGEIFEQQ